MTIRKLLNPKSDIYLESKKLVNSVDISWYRTPVSVEDVQDNEEDTTNNIRFFSHGVLMRPGCQSTMYPKVNSDYVEGFNNLLWQIFQYNRIEVYCMYRINLNLVLPSAGIQRTPSHQDHPFPHKNIIIYLTDAGGATVCEGERYEPEEDDIITFEGEHYHELPKEKDRIILVATYLESPYELRT